MKTARSKHERGWKRLALTASGLAFEGAVGGFLATGILEFIFGAPRKGSTWNFRNDNIHER